jgi:hypothetical protein
MYRVYSVENGQRTVASNFRNYENAVHHFYSQVLDTVVCVTTRPIVKMQPDGTMVAFFVDEGIFHHLERINFED